MADSKKPSTKSGNRNDSRPNGKAPKKNPGPAAQPKRELTPEQVAKEAARKKRNYTKRLEARRATDKNIAKITAEQTAIVDAQERAMKRRARHSDAQARRARSQKIVAKVKAASGK